MALTEHKKQIAMKIAEKFGDVTLESVVFNNGDNVDSAFTFEAFVEGLLDSMPKPDPVGAIKELGKRLAARLDEDDWNYIEPFLRECEAPITQPASEPSEQKPAALPFAIFDQEMADLRRFHECSMDNEWYDVPKDRMKRLAEIGLVRRVSANYYEHTNFGLSVLDGDFDTSPQPDYKAQRDALLKCLALIDPKLDFSGWENGQGEDIGDEINAAIA